MNKNSGCAGLVIVIFVIAAIMWGLAILLYILAFAIPLAGLLFGGFLIKEAWDERRQHTLLDSLNDELSELTRDASFEISDLIIQWDMIIMTKGIGTPLENDEFHDNSRAAEIRRQLVAARELLDSAETPAHKIEAVLRADVTLDAARTILP